MTSERKIFPKGLLSSNPFSSVIKFMQKFEENPSQNCWKSMKHNTWPNVIECKFCCIKKGKLQKEKQYERPSRLEELQFLKGEKTL
ncbi:hypothetical protein CEXT_686891 [Caerostris extrusa]|uniref:Uncharacterized protein n=1 Tax=Caerostris extrusa TaxID=172846 RepID=A0AAV4T8C8_CAEEX|nr:hypothetical protein CEXT_686891 [Caerostris extrusa]